MYCANCGTPISQSLSFCNRCGASLKEREQQSNTGAISAFLTAITLIGVAGLGIMLGGALVLRKEAGLTQDLIGIFMLFTFLIVGVTETMLIRQLSRLTATPKQKRSLPGAEQIPFELRPAQPLPLVEPVASVTDNTTRTLEYSRRQQ
ncbi:MAG TPA: hypothetical protein VLB68_32155 [Pyrinomonadaceae bacterium]|nr:hypothetical protein [Pyrinomonadaceae bacterium]